MWLEDLSAEWHRKNGPVLEEADELRKSKHLGMSSVSLLREIQKNNPTHVLGIDEVGLGAYAGPLVVGAVLAPIEWSHPALKDSKAFGGNKKELHRAEVLRQLDAETPRVRCFIYRTPVEAIDAIGIGRALMNSFRALMQVLGGPRILSVVDGNKHVRGMEHIALPKADTFVPQVMAASIVAKVSRDTEMIELSRRYPVYSFSKNKGYGGSDEHLDALRKHGPCPEHRKSYEPIKQLLYPSIT